MSDLDLTTESNFKTRYYKKKRDLLPYKFILPSVILILLINLYPFILGIYYSLSNGTLIQAGKFIGFENFKELLTNPEFWHSLYFSFIFAVFGVIGSYVLGLVLALILNKEMPGRGFFRASLLIPWIIPSVVTIVSWRWMIGDQNGLVNIILGWFGIRPILFLSSNFWAIVSVIVVKVWRSFPFMMITILSGLQSIDSNLYEAAKIDGAGRWKTFWYITLPQIKMISIICWILMTIWCFNDFDTIWLLTQGGPANATENLIVLAYQYTFSQYNLGIGSAISIVSLVILMGFAVFMLKLQDKE